MQTPTPMTLRILLPNRVLLQHTDVLRIVAESQAGCFGLWPHRLDCVTALVPGILIYETAAHGEAYMATDEGILVKNGLNVAVSVRNAIAGMELGKLRETIEREFMSISEQEQNVRTVLAKMESGFVRRVSVLHRD